MRRLLLVLLVLVVILVAVFVERCERREPIAAEGCGPGTKNGECRAHLSIGQLGLSVWDDGTVAIAIPVDNDGGRGAGNVRVSRVRLDAGTRTSPIALPVHLGEILPLRRGVVEATFKGVADPGSYSLEVSGTYIDRGKLRAFRERAPVAIRSRNTAPIPVATGTLTKVHTSGTATAPSAITPEGDDGNQVGPPVPRGPKLSPFTISPNVTPVTKAPPAGGTAAGITFDQDTPSSVGAINNVPPDPSTVAATSGNVVVDTDNTVMQFSIDGGKTFTAVDPTTIFPASDGGICCDQVVVYDKGHDLVFWLQQYNAPSGGGTNRLRLAWASPASMQSNINAWTYIDLTQSGFNSGGNLDYPDLALSGANLYVSVDGTDSTGKTSGLIVTRISLADLAAPGTSVGYSYLGPNETADQANAHGSHLTQGIANEMYWAGATDTSHLEIFQWPESSGSVSTSVTPVNSWCNSATDYANLPPDGMQWPDTGHLGGAGNIVAATYVPPKGSAHGQIWFGWGAGGDGSDCSQTGRPLPFVKIAQVDDTSLQSVSEYHIWNSAYAFSYPALATDPSGNVGVSVAFAGPSNFPSTTVGYIGDFTVYYVESSDVSLKFYIVSKSNTFTFINPNDGSINTDSSGNPIVYTRYGDYFDVRNSGSDGSLFSNQGYAVKLNDATKSTTCLSVSGCTFHPHYEQWGRPVATPRPPR